MNIQEMHIAIGTEMNKINSALFENILPQEVDFAINANIQRFAKQRYGAHANLKQKGFEMSQKRIDDLRTLVVPNYTDRSYLPDTIDPDYTQKVISFFPADYMLSVASRFRVAYDECGSITPTTSTETINVTLLNFDTLKANGLVDWTNFQLWLTNPNPGTAVKVLDLETAGANYALTEDFTYVIRIILQKLRTAYPTTYEFYWENYKGSYYKNTIVIVNKTGNAELWGVVANTLAYDVNPTTITKMYYSNSVTLTTSGKAVQQDDIFAMQADPFNKTVADFPLYYTSGYQYNTYIDVNEFVVTNYILSYIRTPRTVSIYFDESCDLPEHTHSEIVSMTVDYLLEAVQAGERYKTHQEIVATNE